MKHRQEMDRLYASATKNDRFGVVYGLILVFLLANIPLPFFPAFGAEDPARSAALPIKAASDSAIESRLRKVTDKIDNFKNVNIDVNDGVVQLSGTAPGIEMPEPIQTIRVLRLRAAPSETTATTESQAHIAAERETDTMDVSPDTQLDEQIKEDLSEDEESNLLVEG